jgi:hypothetical protein
VHCHGTRCPLLTAFFSLSFSPKKTNVGVPRGVDFFMFFSEKTKCAYNCLLVSMGAWTEGLAYADPRAMAPISSSEICIPVMFSIICDSLCCLFSLQLVENIMNEITNFRSRRNKELWKTGWQSIYQWTEDVNSKFKFECLRYRPRGNRPDFNYTSPDGSVIEEKKHLRDIWGGDEQWSELWSPHC